MVSGGQLGSRTHPRRNTNSLPSLQSWPWGSVGGLHRPVRSPQPPAPRLLCPAALGRAWPGVGPGSLDSGLGPGILSVKEAGTCSVSPQQACEAQHSVMRAASCPLGLLCLRGLLTPGSSLRAAVGRGVLCFSPFHPARPLGGVGEESAREDMVGITVLSPLRLSRSRAVASASLVQALDGCARHGLAFAFSILCRPLKTSGQLGLTQLVQAKMHVARALGTSC